MKIKESRGLTLRFLYLFFAWPELDAAAAALVARFVLMISMSCSAAEGPDGGGGGGGSTLGTTGDRYAWTCYVSKIEAINFARCVHQDKQAGVVIQPQARLFPETYPPKVV